ncbi:uncharacterized protein LOC124160080 [Ischnura elegans]|uniref:uncharacterized protein LOC124160080 n=1 Tax=Ischnura elegans TaxID=197161 RepID=UPI001ED87DD0|nr:uncharacterized protein LOC124160080 [Ischnura elegans]
MTGNYICDPHLWTELKKVSDSALVIKVPDGIERPLSESDFKDNTILIEKSILYLRDNLDKLVACNAVQHMKKLEPSVKSFLVSCLMVCGEQSANNSWTTSVTVETAEEILNRLCVIFNIGSQNLLEDLQQKWKVDICKLMLTELRQKLTKSTWKRYPASFLCYKWILSKAKAQQVSENFEEFLNAALISLDDFEVCNQVNGLNCLSIIISSVTRTQLCHLAYDDVIFCAMEHLLYTKDPDIVVCLVPCLCNFLQKVEKGYTHKEDSLQFTRYDKALKIFLGNMEMEQYVTRRKAYVEVLPFLLDGMGLPMLRWSKRLLRIFEDYLFVDDGSNGISTLKSLEAFKVYLLHTWPLIPKNMGALLELLLKLLVEMTDLDPSRRISSETLDAILYQIESCLFLIMKTSSSKTKDLCAGIESVSLNSKFDEIIKRIFVCD